MANTTFVNGTVVQPSWLNDVNNLVYFGTVNSISALRTSLKTGPSVVSVIGYYTAGDGGGGLYWYDSTDTTSLDNGGTIIVANDGGRWKLNLTSFVSVKQFGAKGDYNGTTGTDDTTAIQNCINWVQANTNTGTYGSYSPSVGTGVVYFPQGSYKVTAALVVASKICVKGEGQTEYSYGSRLTQVTVNTDLFQISASAGSTSFSIEDMVLRSNAGVGTGHLVNMVRSGGGTVNSQRYVHVTFAQPQAFALSTAGDDILIEGCLVDVSQQSGDAFKFGTSTMPASQVRISGTDFFNCTNSCIKFVNIDGFTWGADNTVSQPNTTTKTLRVFDAISTAPTLATNIAISGGTIKGARTLFGGNNVTNLSIQGVTAIQGGIGAGEVNHMLVFTGNCSGNISGNYFRGSYDTANFYNDAGALNVFAQIAANTFVNDGGAGDALNCPHEVGRIGSNYFSGFTNRQMGEKRATTGSAVNLGAIAAGAKATFNLTVAGAAIGDTVNVGSVSSAWIAQTGICIEKFISGAGTVAVEYRNLSAGSLTPPAHDIWCEVTR